MTNKQIQQIIFEHFNPENVLYIGKTGSESLLSQSRNTDIDIIVLLDTHPTPVEKRVITVGDTKLDIFIRDYSIYLETIYMNDIGLDLLTKVIYWVFAESIYDTGITKFNHLQYTSELERLIVNYFSQTSCNPQSKATVAIAKSFNRIYLLSVLKEGRTTLNEYDKQILERIYAGDRKTIEEVLIEFQLTLSPRITRII